MGASVDFYLYAKNNNTDKYENISWRSDNGILPMATYYSSYVGAVREDFKPISEFGEDSFNFLTEDGDMNDYYVKKLCDIKHLKPIQKIMYMHYNFIDMLENDEIFEEDLDSCYTYNDYDEYKFPIVIDPKLYGQLIQEEKQKYVPFIYKESDRNDIYEMNVAKICRRWLGEFEWVNNNFNKYDFDDALVVARIFW